MAACEILMQRNGMFDLLMHAHEIYNEDEY